MSTKLTILASQKRERKRNGTMRTMRTLRIKRTKRMMRKMRKMRKTRKKLIYFLTVALLVPLANRRVSSSPSERVAESFTVTPSLRTML